MPYFLLFHIQASDEIFESQIFQAICKGVKQWGNRLVHLLIIMRKQRKVISFNSLGHTFSNYEYACKVAKVVLLLLRMDPIKIVVSTTTLDDNHMQRNNYNCAIFTLMIALYVSATDSWLLTVHYIPFYYQLFLIYNLHQFGDDMWCNLMQYEIETWGCYHVVASLIRGLINNDIL